MDDRDWEEYYLGLIIALVGTLKFADVEPLARGLALAGAAAAQSLMGKQLAAVPFGPEPSRSLPASRRDTTPIPTTAMAEPTRSRQWPSARLISSIVGALLALAFLLVIGVRIWVSLHPAPPLALVIDVQGQVEVRRKASDRLLPAAFGLELFFEDAVITYEASTSNVLCDNGLLFHLDDHSTLIVRCEETEEQPAIGQIPSDLSQQLIQPADTITALPSQIDLAAAAQIIHDVPLNDRAQRFLRAKLYERYSQPELAIVELEPLADEGGAPRLAQALADLYFQVGSLDRAETSYTIALDEARSRDDLIGQADALVGLGHIAEAKGDVDTATARWQGAVELYWQEGEIAQANWVAALLQPEESTSNWTSPVRYTLLIGLILLLVVGSGLAFYRLRSKRPKWGGEFWRINVFEPLQTRFRIVWTSVQGFFRPLVTPKPLVLRRMLDVTAMLGNMLGATATVLLVILVLVVAFLVIRPTLTRPTPTPIIAAIVVGPTTTPTALQTPSSSRPGPLDRGAGVVAGPLDIHSGPGLDYPVIGAAPDGTAVQVTGHSADGRWWQIAHPGGPGGYGWVLAEFVELRETPALPIAQASPPPTATPTPTDISQSSPISTLTPGVVAGVLLGGLNIYSGPGTNYPVIGTADENTTVQVTGRDASGDWLQIAHPAAPGGYGWVEAQFVQIETEDTSAMAIAMASPPPTVSATPAITASPTNMPSPTGTRPPTPTGPPRTPTALADWP